MKQKTKKTITEIISTIDYLVILITFLFIWALGTIFLATTAHVIYNEEIADGIYCDKNTMSCDWTIFDVISILAYIWTVIFGYFILRHFFKTMYDEGFLL